MKTSDPARGLLDFFLPSLSITKKSFMKNIVLLILAVAMIITPTFSQTKPLRIMMIGGHPDDCELAGGGTAILYRKMGHAVKFLSVTNGDAGHQEMDRATIASRRLAEAKEAGRRLDVEYEVLSNHDGGLVPSLEVRLEIIRKIREWGADIVFSPRPNDYHPDHRYTGVLVLDAAYLVGVPNIAPDTPPLKKNPVFFYFQDSFQRPNAFRPDVSIDISSVFDQKVEALDAHQSQFYEWLPWIGGYLDQVPKDSAARKKWLAVNRARKITPGVRESLKKWYGSKAADISYAEAFEICEYGTQPTEEDLRRLFPMLGKDIR